MMRESGTSYDTIFMVGYTSWILPSSIFTTSITILVALSNHCTGCSLNSHLILTNLLPDLKVLPKN